MAKNKVAHSAPSGNETGDATDFLFGANAPDPEPAPEPPHPDNAPPAAADAGPAPDPFDPESLRLSPDLTAALAVKKVLLTVPVRKPDKSWFVRVHPGPAYRLPTGVIVLKDPREETYLVARPLWPSLAAESTFKFQLLAAAVSAQGALFLWPVNIPRQDGRADEWSRSALEIVDMAQTRWVRVQANMNTGAYEPSVAQGTLPEPEWPDLPFREMLRLAFKDRYIDSPDHPVLRRLRGEV